MPHLTVAENIMMDYLVNEQTVTASAGDDEGSKRVEVIIPPEVLEEDR